MRTGRSDAQGSRGSIRSAHAPGRMAAWDGHALAAQSPLIPACSQAWAAHLPQMDSGSGFSETDLDHIFERFYRSGEPSKSGYGIGLAFARRIVTSQSGSLQAYNAPDGGACFDMRIYKTSV